MLVKNWLWKHEWRSISNNLIFQCLQSDKAQNKQHAQSDHPSGLEKLVLSTGSPQQGSTLFPFHFYLHPEITSERRSSQQGLSSLVLRKKIRELVSISGSIRDALKAFALILPLCQRPVCSCATVQLEYTEICFKPCICSLQKAPSWVICPTLAALLVCPQGP